MRTPGRATSTCRGRHSRSAPIPTTWSSDAARRWRSGRQPVARSITSCAPTDRRARGTRVPTRSRSRSDARTNSEPPHARLAGTAAGEVRFLGYIDGELGSDLVARGKVARGAARAATRGRAGPRSVEALPAPPRPPARRSPHVRRRRRSAGSALLPRARTAGPPATRVAAVRGRRARSRGRRQRNGRGQAECARGARESVRVDHEGARRRAADGVSRARAAIVSRRSGSRTASRPPRCSS